MHSVYLEVTFKLEYLAELTEDDDDNCYPFDLAHASAMRTLLSRCASIFLLQVMTVHEVSGLQRGMRLL